MPRAVSRSVADGASPSPPGRLKIRSTMAVEASNPGSADPGVKTPNSWTLSRNSVGGGRDQGGVGHERPVGGIAYPECADRVACVERERAEARCRPGRP